MTAVIIIVVKDYFLLHFTSVSLRPSLLKHIRNVGEINIKVIHVINNHDSVHRESLKYYFSQLTNKKRSVSLNLFF